MSTPILIYSGKNRDENGKPLDLYGYLVNELDAYRIKARVQEVGGLGGALKLLNAARELCELRTMNVDLYWTPRTIEEVRREYERRAA